MVRFYSPSSWFDRTNKHRSVSLYSEGNYPRWTCAVYMYSTWLTVCTEPAAWGAEGLILRFLRLDFFNEIFNYF